MTLMHKILIVEDDQVQLEMVISALEEYTSEFDVITAKDGVEAVTILKKQDISVLVTDLYMTQMCGLDLLAYMSRNLPEVPCIVMTGFGSPEAKIILARHNIYHYLNKPFRMEVLTKVILDAIIQYEHREIMGRFHLSGLLQILHTDKISCSLEVSSPGKCAGRISIVKGELDDAKCGDFTGEEAVVAMICWDDVTFRRKSLPEGNAKHNIERSLQSIIDEAARIKENGDFHECLFEETEQEYEELFQQAVYLAECNRLEEAQQILKTLLNNNQKNYILWLWYSRVSDRVDSKLESLKKAALISPDNSELNAELERLESAGKAGCFENNKVDHCPFCWATIWKKITTCPNCKSHLQIHKYPAPILIKKNSQILNKAVHRYKKIVLVKKSFRDNFNLCLAYFNLGRWSDALEILNKAKELEPDNSFCNDQLNALISHMSHHIGSSSPKYYHSRDVEKR